MADPVTQAVFSGSILSTLSVNVTSIPASICSETMIQYIPQVTFVLFDRNSHGLL